MRTQLLLQVVMHVEVSAIATQQDILHDICQGRSVISCRSLHLGVKVTDKYQTSAFQRQLSAMPGHSQQHIKQAACIVTQVSQLQVSTTPCNDPAFSVTDPAEQLV